ncbi:hypothetical protein [Sphingopyxis flava]|uniref:Uncharacterized protein n=1 Tax=Sphingopyxis flava TaxID=1507287 RepID=A0A1T5BS60_9SPHN|nr:hypothetical protein [Sphingopyxis flava]SKB49763.1 hypothetical protein SAMN06295937_100770 [Sphingopyxis flava]
MANVTTLRDDSLPILSSAAARISKVVSLASDAADSGDTIEIFGFPTTARGKIVDAQLRVSATLGASCTVQLRVNRGGSSTAITAATTAGGASKVTGVAQASVPFEIQGGDIVELVVAGADIAAAATASVDLLIA